MAMLVQTTKPKIEFYHTNQDGSATLYYVFSPYSDYKYPSGQGLVSYNFQHSVNQFSSQWSCQIREDSHRTGNKFFDEVCNFDIIKIYENNTDVPDYIGIVTTTSYSANASGLTKSINLSGSGIEFLLSYLTISLDTAAMAFSNDETSHVETANTILKQEITSNDEILKKLQVIYKTFTDIATDKFSEITNTLVVKMIEYWFEGTDMFIGDNSKFAYPISTNMFSTSAITYIGYISNLLPQNVYEIHGVIINGKPKIRVRELPFTSTRWKKLYRYELPPESLENYTLTRTIENINTVFVSYVEGSERCSEFYKNVNAGNAGYNNVEKSEQKIPIYGYKPLTVTFAGFDTTYAEDENVEDVLLRELKKLNKKLKEWFEHNDEYYDGTFSCVNIHSNKDKPVIGDRLKILNGEFYITGIEHSWNYGASPKLIYHCERGAVYNDDGSFVGCIKGITKNLAELQKGDK